MTLSRTTERAQTRLVRAAGRLESRRGRMAPDAAADLEREVARLETELDTARSRDARRGARAPRRMCRRQCMSPDCETCCPTQLDKETLGHAYELAARDRRTGAHIPAAPETRFPHVAGQSRCCPEHPLWRELVTEAGEIRRAVWEGPEGEAYASPEDVPTSLVRRQLEADPRWPEWLATEGRCVDALETDVRRATPKARGSHSVELAERRRRFVDAGGDTTSAEWTDTLRSTERAVHARHGLSTHRPNPRPGTDVMRMARLARDGGPCPAHPRGHAAHRPNPSRPPPRRVTLLRPQSGSLNPAAPPFTIELRRVDRPEWNAEIATSTARDAEGALDTWRGRALHPGDLVRVVEGEGRMVWLGFADVAGELRAAPTIQVRGGKPGDPRWLNPIDGWEGSEMKATDLLVWIKQVDLRRLTLASADAAHRALGYCPPDVGAEAREAVEAARRWALGEGPASDAERWAKATHAHARHPWFDKAFLAAANAAEIPSAKAHLQRGHVSAAIIYAEGMVRGQWLASSVRHFIPLASVLASRLGLPDPVPFPATRSNPRTPARRGRTRR